MVEFPVGVEAVDDASLEVDRESRVKERVWGLKEVVV